MFRSPHPMARSNGTLHVPDGDGPWPGVLVFPDAGGARETFRQMGDRLAGMGYVALIPDIYYRAGQWAPFDAATLFTDRQERARLSSLTSVLTNDRIIADAGAYADFLLARPEVRGSAIGTTGYCLGGRMSLIAAGGLGRKIAAAASFHGGRLAVADEPLEPSPVGGPYHRHGLRGRRHRRRLVHHRAGRATGKRAHRRRCRPHPGVLSCPPRIRGARQPDLRRARRTPGTGKHSRSFTWPASKTSERSQRPRSRLVPRNASRPPIR